MRSLFFAGLLFLHLLLLLGCDAHRYRTPKQLVDAPAGFTFSGTEYPIASATISGWLGDPEYAGAENSLRWQLEINGAPIEGDQLGPPRITFDGLDIDVARWQDIDGFTQRWTEWKNPRTDDGYATTYHSGHDFVVRGFLRINGRYGNQFRVVGNGGLPNTTPFQFDAPFRFTEITVMGNATDDEDSVKRKLQNELPNHDLVLSKFEHLLIGNLEHTRATFSPAEEENAAR